MSLLADGCRLARRMGSAGRAALVDARAELSLEAFGAAHARTYESLVDSLTELVEVNDDSGGSNEKGDHGTMAVNPELEDMKKGLKPELKRRSFQRRRKGDHKGDSSAWAALAASRIPSSGDDCYDPEMCNLGGGRRKPDSKRRSDQVTWWGRDASGLNGPQSYGVYVINLDRSPSRLAAFKAEASGAGLGPFTRVAAVDGRLARWVARGGGLGTENRSVDTALVFCPPSWDRSPTRNESSMHSKRSISTKAPCEGTEFRATFTELSFNGPQLKVCFFLSQLSDGACGDFSMP